MDNPMFESEVLNLLSVLRASKERLQAQYESDMKAIDSQIDAVITTAQLLRQSPTVVPFGDSMAPLIPVLVGKSIRQGCIEIAKRNDGVVRVREARDALIKAGVLRQTKNSWGIVNTTLIRSKEFVKHPTEVGAFMLDESTLGHRSAA